MPTFLTHSKMNPALAARIEASVGGRTGTRGKASKATPPTLRAALRLGALAVVVLIVALVVREQRARDHALQSAKDELLTAMSAARQQVPKAGFAVVEQATARIRHESDPYSSDLVAPDMHNADALRQLLDRRTLYVRLQTDLANNPDRFAMAVAESRVDLFALCLKRPPTDRSEKEVMKRVSEAYHGGEDISAITANVHPMHDAMVTLNLLDPRIPERVNEAKLLKDVLELKRTWDQANVPQRVMATEAQLFIAVLDEPKMPGTAVEMDGASNHWVRVVIADLGSDRVHLRLRRHLDPAWVSERRRSQYALGLEACRLAYDVRAELLTAR